MSISYFKVPGADTHPQYVLARVGPAPSYPAKISGGGSPGTYFLRPPIKYSENFQNISGRVFGAGR